MTTPDKMRQNVLEVLDLLVCHSLSADAGSPHKHMRVPVHTHTLLNSPLWAPGL